MKPRISKNRNQFAEIWGFIKENKAWWLAPIIIMLIIIGLLVVLGQSSAFAPFIYTFF